MDISGTTTKRSKSVQHFCFIDEQERMKRFKTAVLKIFPSMSFFMRKMGCDGHKDSNLNYIINGTSVAKYLSFCSVLHLDPFDLLHLDNMRENRKENILENKIMSMYFDLNRRGRVRFVEMLEDIWNIPKYKRDY